MYTSVLPASCSCVLSFWLDGPFRPNAPSDDAAGHRLGCGRPGRKLRGTDRAAIHPLPRLAAGQNVRNGQPSIIPRIRLPYRDAKAVPAKPCPFGRREWCRNWVFSGVLRKRMRFQRGAGVATSATCPFGAAANSTEPVCPAVNRTVFSSLTGLPSRTNSART
jgi:hypothetical protein